MTTGRINQVSKIQSRWLAPPSLKIMRIKIHKHVRSNLRPSAKKSNFVALPPQSSYDLSQALSLCSQRRRAKDVSTSIANAVRNHHSSKVRIQTLKLVAIPKNRQSEVASPLWIACPHKSGLKQRQLGILFQCEGLHWLQMHIFAHLSPVASRIVSGQLLLRRRVLQAIFPRS